MNWISVEDELPEDYGRFWCYVRVQTDIGISHEQDNCSFNAGEKRWNSELWKGGEIVTHWIPLPEPPQPEGK